MFLLKCILVLGLVSSIFGGILRRRDSCRLIIREKWAMRNTQKLKSCSEGEIVFNYPWLASPDESLEVKFRQPIDVDFCFNPSINVMFTYRKSEKQRVNQGSGDCVKCKAKHTCMMKIWKPEDQDLPYQLVLKFNIKNHVEE